MEKALACNISMRISYLSFNGHISNRHKDQYNLILSEAGYKNKLKYTDVCQG